MFEKLIAPLYNSNRTLSKELLDEMRCHAKMISLKKNDVLVSIGSRHESVYITVRGSLIKYLITHEGNKIPVWFYFDEVYDVALCPDSYFLGRPTKYEIRALEDALVFRFNKHNIDKWLRNYPEFNRFYLTDVVAASVAAEEMRAYQLVHRPLEFLNYLDRKYPVFRKRLSSKNIARFIGVSPEWYSKLKRRM